jgi:hypothetical protein
MFIIDDRKLIKSDNEKLILFDQQLKGSRNRTNAVFVDKKVLQKN